MEKWVMSFNSVREIPLVLSGLNIYTYLTRRRSTPQHILPKLLQWTNIETNIEVPVYSIFVSLF
jgi:hypothetical protein